MIIDFDRCQMKARHDGGWNPELVALAKRLRRRGRTKGERLSYRAVAADLAKRGYLNVNGRPYAAESIKAMVSGWARTPLVDLGCPA
jgi:hypothetical protein